MGPTGVQHTLGLVDYLNMMDTTVSAASHDDLAGTGRGG
jgi:hypothetical protein